jgi:hypothetical protein
MIDKQEVKGPISWEIGPFYCYGSPGRTRTSDRVVNSHLLYRLSYRGICRYFFVTCKSETYKYHIARVKSTNFLTFNSAFRSLPRQSVSRGPFPRFSSYPSRPFFSSMITCFAIAFNVSNTPVPSAAHASKSGEFRGLSTLRNSSTGTTFGRSLLLYWMT